MKHKRLIQFIFYTVMCILGAFIVVSICMHVPLRYLLPALIITATVWSILEVVLGEYIFKDS